jgi:hypothetical protein
MNRVTKLSLLGTVLVCAVAPALALAGGPPSNPGSTRGADQQPGPNASLPAKAKAYGRYCQNQSKKHVAGQKGTPFSQCVTAMAKLAVGKTDSPTVACKAMSKKRVPDEKGTPFSRCVAAGAKLLREQHQENP